MRIRGFIIAAERYPLAIELVDADLSGTTAAALSFWRWLVWSKQARPEDVVLCADRDALERAIADPAADPDAGPAPRAPDLDTVVPTDRASVVRALEQFAAVAHDATLELYFYFSGHGLSYQDTPHGLPADLLVLSDYVRPEESGDACIKLEPLRERLYDALGPGQHFYFIDACRNAVDPRRIEPASLGKVFPRSGRQKPTVYTLYSTAPGDTAPAGGEFARALLDGLKGGGRAKGWRATEMWVVFELLCDYVKSRLPGQQASGERWAGAGDGRIIKVEPIRDNRCTVTVRNAVPGDEFQLQISTAMAPWPRVEPVRGATHVVSLRPFDYVFRLSSKDGSELPQVVPPAPVLLDLYDECRVEFEKPIPASGATTHGSSLGDSPGGTRSDLGGDPGAGMGGGMTGGIGEGTRSDGRDTLDGAGFRGGTSHRGPSPTSSARAGGMSGESDEFLVFDDDRRGWSIDRSSSVRREDDAREQGATSLSFPAPSEAPTGRLHVEVLGDVAVDVRHLLSDEVRFQAVGSQTFALAAGVYEVKLRENGVTVHKETVSIDAGGQATVRLIEAPEDPTRDSILAAVSAPSGYPGRRVADFSESLGPMADANLALWLSLLGASRIVDPAGHYKKLDHLPLERFDSVAPTESPLYVLAGISEGATAPDAAVSTGAAVVWQPMRPVAGLRNVYEFRTSETGGPRLLSFRTGGRGPFTLSVYGLPGRVTLVALAQGEGKEWDVHQFILPPHHIQGGLPVAVRAGMEALMTAPETTPGLPDAATGARQAGIGQLPLVRTMALAQRRFARRRQFTPMSGTQEHHAWLHLTTMKWLDPIMSLIAAFELIAARGVEETRDELAVMVTNLRSYFGGLPDTEALAKQIGMEWSRPRSSPLLLRALLAFEEEECRTMLPLGMAHLAFDGLWVSWRGARLEVAAEAEVVVTAG